ncbi:MAG: DUF3857 domain-containing protein [Phycisphaerae bacterium]
MRAATVVEKCALVVGLAAVCAPEAWGQAPEPATAEQIAKWIADAGDAKKYKKADFAYVLDEADVYVQKSGLATTEACQVIKILTDKGVKSKSVLRWEFDPDTYRVTVKQVRIHRKDGPIEDVNIDALITQPAPQHMIYWGNQQHVLGLPRLEIGDSLEIRTSKIGFNIAYLSNGSGAGGGSGGASGGSCDLVPPMPGHWYEVTLFQGNHPILRKRYSVHMPKDMPVQYEVYNGSLKSSLWFKGDTHIYTWTAEDVPAVKREKRMVALDDCVPKLVMATLEDWHAKSRWFHEVNEPQFEADDAIRAKVAEITEGLTTDDEKIAACVHWVADNVRYFGTKRGPSEGYTLHKSTETFRDRGGVCKDKAGMAVTMLRVLGYEVYPALTMAGSRVDYIPADQFNHTVTVMRNKDGTFRILDPTWVPLNRDLWSTLEQEQGLVYGTPEGQDLTASPYYKPDVNKRSVTSRGEIRDDGTLVTRLRFLMDGAADNRFRRIIHGYSKPEQKAALETRLGIAPNARIEEYTHIDPYDYSQDGFIDMTVSAPAYAAGGEGFATFRLPLMSHPLNGFFRASFMEAADEKEREYAARFWATRMLEYEETLKLPDGWKVTKVPEPKTLDSGSASLSFEATPGDGSLTYRFVFKLKKGVVPADEYGDYKKAVDAMKKLGNEWIVCATDQRDTELATDARLGTGTGGTR